jgi:Tfp pilus assembly protein PilN
MRAVNLIPSDERAGSAIGAGRSQGGAYAVLAVLGGLAILALLYGIARHQISSRRAQAASLTAQAQRAEATAAQLAPYTSFMALREQRMQAVSQLADSRFDWSYAFHELGRVLPRDASISSLDGTIGSSTGTAAPATAAPATAAPATAAPATAAPATAAPATAGSPATTAAPGAAASAAVTSATPPGSVPIFTLSGCATSQSEVALTLQRLRLINGVSEVTLQGSTKSSSGAGAGGSGGVCVGNDPAFTAQISFDPLPAASATSSSTRRLTSATGVGR